MPTPDRREKMANYETVKEEDEGELKKDRSEDVQSPAKFKTQRPDFLEMLEAFESM